MKTSERHFEPLRPNRVLGGREEYEFTHGTNSVCVYDIHTMDFIKEIPVGQEPDCHATSLDNRYLYIACIKDGLYCIDLQSLSVVKRIDTGGVYGINVMPDGSTMLLHDWFGGIIILKDIQDMDKIHIYKRIDVIGKNKAGDTLGGKGHFIDGGRYYICGGWCMPNIYMIDLENYSWKIPIENDPLLRCGDDLVVSKDKTKAYVACYNNRTDSYVAVIDIKSKKAVKKIKTGRGTCGLTMSNDERYVVASNDMDDSISVIDTSIDEVVSTISARTGFEKLNIQGYIQGISVAHEDEIYVYGCAGNGALVKFWNILGAGNWMISYSGGKCTNK